MKKIVIIVFVVILILILVGGFIVMSKPDKMTEVQKQKAIADMLGRKVNAGSDVKTGSTIFNGKYASFRYPAAAVVYTYKGNEDMKNNDSDGDSFSFDIKSPRLVFNFNANKSSDVSLLDNSSVKLRHDKASGYTEKEEKVDKINALSFTKDRSGEFPAEKSLFFIDNGILYTISISGSSIRDIEKLSNDILKTFVFVN